MKTRLKEFDYLRAIAVLAVIVIHVTSRYVNINSIAYLLNQGVRFAVPLFIVLSGFLLYYSDINKPKAKKSNFLLKRLNKIFIPYVVWTLNYMLYNIRNNLNAVFTLPFLSSLVKNLAYGKAAPQLYFIIIILQMYLIFGLLTKLMNSKYEKPLMLVSFFITAYINLGAYLFRWYIYIIPKTSFGYSLLFPTWLFYFVFGMYFAKHRKSFKTFLVSSKLKLGLLWILSFVSLYIDSRLSNTYGSSMKPTVMLYCFTSFLFFYSVFSIGSLKESAFVRWVSEQAFFIYFSHVLLIDIIIACFRIIGIRVVWSSIIGIALLLLLDTLASLALAYIAYRIPYSKYLGCTPKLLHMKNKRA